MIDGRISGTSGDVGVLSFGGTKLTAAGRGGAVLSNRQEVVERIKRHVMRGNDLSPLSELEAAALVPQWRMLQEWNERRVENVRILTGLLAEFPGLRMLTAPTSRTTSGFYKVGFEYDVTKMSGLSRESFCRAMQAEGVAFSPGFRGLHRIHASRRFRAAGPLPVADVADDRIVVLHHPVLLDGDTEMREIANAARKVGVFAEELSRQPIPAFSRPEDFDE
jgi:dTDP-4-amino-4,6-dideoxygalactose transaminase